MTKSRCNTRTITEWDLKKQQAEAELAALKATLEKEKLLTMQQLDVLKAQQGMMSQLLPKGESKPLEGKIETNDRFGYIAEVVAYSAVEEMAAEITAALTKSEMLPIGATILIVDQLDRASDDLPLVEIKVQLDSFKHALAAQIQQNEGLLQRKALESVALAAPAIATSVLPLAVAALSLTADIAGYFRTDYSIKGQVFEVKKEALVSAVTGQLRAMDRQVYLENFYPLSTSQLITDFTYLHQDTMTLKTLRNRLSLEAAEPKGREIIQFQELVERLKEEKTGLDVNTQGEEIRRIEEQISQHETSINVTQEKLREVNAAVLASDTLVAAFDNFSKAMTTSPDGQTSPKLVQAALRDKIEQLHPDFLLYLKVLSSGGEAVVKRNFWSSGDTSFIGGVVACYILAAADGAVITSGTRVTLSALDYKLAGGQVSKVRRIL